MFLTLVFVLNVGSKSRRCHLRTGTVVINISLETVSQQYFSIRDSKIQTHKIILALLESRVFTIICFYLRTNAAQIENHSNQSKVQI